MSKRKMPAPFRYRDGWRAQVTLKNGMRPTADFDSLEDAKSWLRSVQEIGNTDKPMVLGGPTPDRICISSRMTGRSAIHSRPRRLFLKHIRKSMPFEDSRDHFMNARREPAELRERRATSNLASWMVGMLVVVAALAGLALSLKWIELNGFRSAPRDTLVQDPPSPQFAPNALPQETSPPRAAGPRVDHVTKCVSGAGSASYSDGPCPAGSRAALVTLEPDSNLADGMSPAARAQSMSENRAAAQALSAYERRVAMNADSTVSQCATLNAVVASLDAAARQPLPAFEQDRVREERKRARDRQFALRC